MKFHFYLRFHTKFGESLWLSGNLDELGNNDPSLAIAMEYLDNEFWQSRVEIDRKRFPKNGIIYKYYLKNKDGELISEWGGDRSINYSIKDLKSIEVVDTWNHAGEFENSFYTAPFTNVLLKRSVSKSKKSQPESSTHIFRIKAPLLQKNEVVCLTGNCNSLNNWSETEPILLTKEGNWWTARVDLSNENFPISYKYGILDSKDGSFRFEQGDNRLVYEVDGKHKLVVLHDGFIHLPNSTWKGAGVAIPVFSLRSKNSFGVGEFADMKLLVDWAQETGLKMIQILPINDTIATNSWIDSYPYAAISAFALHPIYVNLAKVAGKKYAAKVVSLKRKQKQLNDLPALDYEEVIRFKMAMLRELYDVMHKECFESEDYKLFFEENKHWLQPYAAFSFFRDKYGSSHFQEWKNNATYSPEEVTRLFSSKSASRKEVLFYCFVQYHLHVQLKEASDYAHKKGIVLKGDIPIGIYRYGCDAWVAPELYNMDAQAGAPPDDFTAVGQNWEFPTYNWKRMQEDGFGWWKQRFQQMSYYFDAFRIDHILGFFRIWSIPVHAVQGIMGHFVPCLPVHYVEFGENGVWFDYDRFCKPFINDAVLDEVFGDLSQKIRNEYLVRNDHGGYDLKPEFTTQRQVENYFSNRDVEEDSEYVKLGLYDLISNVIFFEQEGSKGQEFHFRISMEKTLSFKYLIPHVQEKLKVLYVNYFYQRQDEFWKKEAMQKLPALKYATNMLICGEDLGMVPHCVPDVMTQLGILSLEIQRMPKDPLKEFAIPDEAPYLSVITPSTHDMSTLRGWWEENRERTQRFYNHVLGQWGDAPYFCESWINRAIVLQHLYSRAMWSVFQLQDILGMSDILRRENPQDERINNPAISKHYWQYRMHISLEDLIKQSEFNTELKDYVEKSGRGTR
jgi:4-alpha-glucanotransferase